MTKKHFGEMIRNLRLAKGLTINEVAQKAGLTASFISQFERGRTQASIASIQKITQAIGIRLSDLFNDETAMASEMPASFGSDGSTKPIVVRKSERKVMAYPEPEKTVKYLLTGLEGKFEVIYSLVEPGGGSGELYTHDSDEECLVVLKGRMEVNVGGQIYVLEEGDAITFSSRIPHGWRNVGSETAELIWVIAPPTF
ncbi:MAG: hypothetical protein A6D91_03145 [Bacillaceae bacterium G1]|nr:hypothetical protein [Bacillota bacterium]OJF17815.1 MAG: hypothetical protein A6D91_03145 [Bacillaceae bacterium G1]